MLKLQIVLGTRLQIEGGILASPHAAQAASMSVQLDARQRRPQAPSRKKTLLLHINM